MRCDFNPQHDFDNDFSAGLPSEVFSDVKNEKRTETPYGCGPDFLWNSTACGSKPNFELRARTKKGRNAEQLSTIFR